MKRVIRAVVLCALLVTAACGGPAPAGDDETAPTLMQLPTLTATLMQTATTTATLTATPRSTQATVTAAASPTATAVVPPTSTPAPTLTQAVASPMVVTPDATLDAAGSALLRGQLLPVRLPPGLTALQAVDAVTPLVLEAAQEPLWTSVTGSAATGWQVAYYDDGADVVFTYVVAPDGELRLLRRAAFGLLPGFPMMRDLITVDSDEALVQAAEQDNLPAEPLTMTLQSAGDAPAWTIAGPDLVTVIAATGG